MKEFNYCFNDASVKALKSKPLDKEKPYWQRSQTGMAQIQRASPIILPLILVMLILKERKESSSPYQDNVELRFHHV